MKYQGMAIRLPVVLAALVMGLGAGLVSLLRRRRML